MWEEKLKIYDELVSKCSRFERKGKTMPYTSANGYMFSLFNKAGEIGIRFSKETQQKYIEEFNSSIYKSYNAVMNSYVLIPENMLNNLNNVSKYLDESYDYVMSLDPK
jgi:NAD+--asparagine ADP-ribosyltransferase